MPRMDQVLNRNLYGVIMLGSLGDGILEVKLPVYITSRMPVCSQSGRTIFFLELT